MPRFKAKQPPSQASRFTGLLRDAHRVRYPGVRPGVLEIPPSERPFDGAILAFRLPDSWRLVTAGLARPDRAGHPPAPDSSGLGIELSVRLPLGSGDQPAPWGPELLRTLADLVVRTGDPFLVGHRLESSTPIDGDPASTATCLLFAQDKDLGNIDGPTGVFTIVQVVPVTPEELQRAKDTSTDEVVEALREESPLLVATLRR